jgi:anaerobic magnesium-protoporphyrin IX monomethyl ester cyclase
MHVTLIHPHSANPANNSAIWPPLGLCRIANFLEKHGHTITIIEDALKNYSMSEIIEQCKNSDIIGIGAMTIQCNRATDIILALKEQYKNVIFVAGGPHFASLANQYLNIFDAIVIGDGELGMLDIINGKRGIITSNTVKEYIPIDFKYIDYMKYGDHLIDNTRAISILTSRGCPYDCKFCASPSLFGRNVTDYNLIDIINNMLILSEKYNIKAFRIMDDNFALNNNKVKEFCKMIKPYNFTMSCLTSAKTVRKDIIDIMYDAGFKFLALGIESGNQNILNIANKNINKKLVINAAKIINDSGIKLEALFMLGLPGETEDTIEESITFAKSLNAYRTHVQFYTPLVGSTFYNEIKNGKHGIILDENTNNYNHRMPVFLPNTITKEKFIVKAQIFFDFIQRKIGT